MRDKIGKNWR